MFNRKIESAELIESAFFQVAIGDRDGVLQVFSAKKGEISHAFKTLPGQEITRVDLGGALGDLPF